MLRTPAPYCEPSGPGIIGLHCNNPGPVTAKQKIPLLPDNEDYEIELETGEIISPLIYSKNEWVNKHKETPLFENIEKESIKIK